MRRTVSLLRFLVGGRVNLEDESLLAGKCEMFFGIHTFFRGESYIFVHLRFALQVVDIATVKDVKGKRVPKYLIHFNGWNRR